MSEYETTIIPLGDTHTLLASFGIGGDNREYQRWRRDDGFRWVDLEDVLNTSPLVFGIDWREWLQDAIETISDQLSSLDITLVSELNDDGDRGTISVNGNSREIQFVLDDNDDFCAVVASVNALIGGRAANRKFKSCEGSDGYWFGLQTVEQCNVLDGSLPQTLNLIFTLDGT